MKLVFILKLIFSSIFFFSLNSVCEQEVQKKQENAQEQVAPENQTEAPDEKKESKKIFKEVLSKIEDLKLLAENEYQKRLETVKAKLDELEVPEKAEKAWNQFWGLELVDKAVLTMVQTPEDLMINTQQYIRSMRFNDKSNFFIKVVRSDLINPNDSDFKKLKMYIKRYNKQIKSLNEKNFKSEKLSLLIKDINGFKSEVNKAGTFSKAIKLFFDKEKSEFSFSDLEKLKKPLERMVSAGSFFQTRTATFISLKERNAEGIKKEKANKAEEQKRFEKLLLEETELSKDEVVEKVKKIFDRLSDFLNAQSVLSNQGNKNLPENLESRLQVFKEITGDLSESQTIELEKAYEIQSRLDAFEEIDKNLEEKIQKTKLFISQLDFWMKTIFEYHAENMSLKIVDIFNRILPAIDSVERYSKLMNLFRDKEFNHGFYKIFQERPFRYTGSETTFWVVLNLENEDVKNHIMKDLGFNGNNALKFINQFNAYGRTAVHEALIRKDYNKLSYILDLKADPNISSRKSIFGLGNKTTTIDFALKAASNYRPRLTKTEAYDFFIRPVIFSFVIDLDVYNFLNKKLIGKTNLERLKAFLPGDKIQKHLDKKMKDFRSILEEQKKKEKEDLSVLKENYQVEKEELAQKEDLSKLERAQLKRAIERNYIFERKNIQSVSIKSRESLKTIFNISPHLEDDFPEDIGMKRLNNYLDVISVYKRQNNLRALKHLFSDLVKDIGFSNEDFLKSYKFLIKDAFSPDQIVDKDGNNLLMIALLHNRRLFKEMLLNPAYINVSANHLNEDKMTPLSLAIKEEKWNDAISLLEISNTKVQSVYIDKDGKQSTPLVDILKVILNHKSYSSDDMRSVLRIFELLTSKNYSWDQVDRRFFESLNLEVFSVAKEEELEKKRQEEKDKQNSEEENKIEEKDKQNSEEENKTEQNRIKTDEQIIRDHFFSEAEENIREDLVRALSFTLESYRWDSLRVNIKKIIDQIRKQTELHLEKGASTQAEIDLAEQEQFTNSKGARREAVSSFLEQKMKQEINNSNLKTQGLELIITKILGLQDSFAYEQEAEALDEIKTAASDLESNIFHGSEDQMLNQMEARVKSLGKGHLDEYRKIQLLIEQMMVDAFLHGEEEILKIMFSDKIVWTNILTSPEKLPEELRKEYRNLFYSLSYSRNRSAELYQIVFDNFFELVFYNMDRSIPKSSEQKFIDFKEHIKKEVNQRDAKGLTPLMHAVKNLADPYVILYFIQAGADTSLKSEDGRSLIDFLKKAHLRFNSSTKTEQVIDALVSFLSIDDRAKLSKSLSSLVHQRNIDHYRASLVRADAMTYANSQKLLMEKLGRDIFKVIEDRIYLTDSKAKTDLKAKDSEPKDTKNNPDQAQKEKKDSEKKEVKQEPDQIEEKKEVNTEEVKEEKVNKEEVENKEQIIENKKLALFFQAILDDRVQEVKELLAKDPSLSHEKDIAGNISLHLVQSLSMAKIFLAEGVDVNAQNNESETPLIVFSKDKTKDNLLEYFLRTVRGLNTRVRDSDNNTFYDIIVDSKDNSRKDLVKSALPKRRLVALEQYARSRNRPVIRGKK